MIFVIGFLLLSRGPDDQGLSCGPCVIIVRERPAGGGSQRLKQGEKGPKSIAGAGCENRRWRREQAMAPTQRMKRGRIAPGREISSAG
jgi:hypothetical protein